MNAVTDEAVAHAFTRYRDFWRVWGDEMPLDQAQAILNFGQAVGISNERLEHIFRELRQVKDDTVWVAWAAWGIYLGLLMAEHPDAA